MKSLRLISQIVGGFFAKIFDKVKMLLSIGYFLALKRMNTVITIVEHTHQSVEYVNGHINDFTFPEHHYEVKVAGKDGEKMLKELDAWMNEHGGKYVFDAMARKNIGAVKPEGYSCICSGVEHFLMVQSFKKFPVSNKFHVFVR